MDYEHALMLLDSPETWCEGAAALASLGDKRALIPLMRAYELSVEADKLCLTDALHALGAHDAAAELLAAANEKDKRLVLRMMQLFPHETHLPALREALLTPELRDSAGTALISQYQTHAWVTLMTDLLRSDDTQVRRWAVEGLRYSPLEAAKNALREHLAREKKQSP